jgi:hypothetical protein
LSLQHGTRVFDIIEDFCIGELKEKDRGVEAVDAPNQM